MKKVMKKMAAGMLIGAFAVTGTLPNMGSSLQKVQAAESNAKTPATEFMDCFDPMPIISKDGLSKTCWGAAAVGARDQDNGLEDQTLIVRDANDPEHDYVYWDGGIIKDDRDPTGQTYYMFASRWDATTGGHFQWTQSEAVCAISKNGLYGPYEDQGLIWPENRNGLGHNVFPLKLRDDDASGYKYAIVTGETRDVEILASNSLDGPWVSVAKVQEQVDKELINLGLQVHGYKDDNGSSKRRFNGKNTCIILRPDGKYEAFGRDGDIALADNITGPWKIASDWTKDPEDKNLWDTVPGMSIYKMEDPVIWYSDGLYHCVVNGWESKHAIYMSSENGIDDWKTYPGRAYLPSADFLRYTDGTINHWDKIERPNVYIEDGQVKAMTFAVVDVAKHLDLKNDTHGSKIVVAPFDGEKLSEFAKREGSAFQKTIKGDAAVADTTAQSWVKLSADGSTVDSSKEWDRNYSAREFMYVQRQTGADMETFGENANANGVADKKRFKNRISEI